MTILAERIRTRKNELGISTSQLAKTLYLSTSAVQQWLTGATIPRSDMIPEICAALECTPDYLFGIEPSAQPEKRTEERTETHACDCISRQAAIDAKMAFLNPNVKRDTKEQTEHDRVFAEGWNACNSHWIKEMENLPSAQPDIAENLYLYKCYIADKDGLQHEVIHTGDIRRVTGWMI